MLTFGLCTFPSNKEECFVSTRLRGALPMDARTAPRQQPVLGVPARPGPCPISETIWGAPGRRGCFTVSSGNVRTDPFDSVNHFLECKTVKGRSYSFPIPLIARIDRPHRFEWRNSLQVTFRKNHGDSTVTGAAGCSPRRLTVLGFRPCCWLCGQRVRPEVGPPGGHLDRPWLLLCV